MKRVLIIVLVLIAISLVVTYFFISSPLKIVAVTVVPTNAQAAFRAVSKPGNFANWLEQNNVEAASPDGDFSFLYDADTFRIKEVLHNAMRISVIGDQTVNTLFNIVPVNIDTSVLRWEAEIETGLNPITRIKRYMEALQLKKNLSGLLVILNKRLSEPQNLYGNVFSVASTDDTLLVAKKVTFKEYPTTNAIYTTIAELQTVLKQNGVEQQAPPMMNVSVTPDSNYVMMVALPVDKKINVTEPFLFRKLVKGNFLVADVNGSNDTIGKTLDMMKLYINDYGKTAMAIPFQMLITDRSTEADSTKWKTKLFYPIVR